MQRIPPTPAGSWISKGNKMSKFEIIRTDINKTVLKAYEFADVEAAVGKYISTLMLVGIIKMGRGGEKIESLGDNKFRLSNGWEIEVCAV